MIDFTDRADCVIVGGGIIGLSLADQLTAVGRHVIVVDYRAAPQIASWAAAGILPPPIKRAIDDPLERLRDLSHRAYPAWLARLRQQSGVSVAIDACGGFYVARTAGERITLQAAVNDWQHDGVRIEPMSAKQLCQVEPHLRRFADNSLIYRLPDEFQVRPNRILKALRGSLSARGVRVIECSDPVAWHSLDGPPLLWTSQGTLRADHVCIAAGPWSSELLTPLGVTLPVEPRRGQIVQWSTGRRLLGHIINEGPRYLVARSDGHLIAGSTVEDVGFDGTTTAAAIAELTDFATGLVPELESIAPATSWAGLRPMSVDGLPYLGHVPGHPQVSVATGHFRSGIHLAPVTACLMQQLICGEPPEIDLSPFSVGR